MTLRRIRSYRVPGPSAEAAQLAQQLAKAEENVDQETRDIRAGFQARLKSIASEKQTSDLQIAPGQSASFDTSLGNVSVTLNKPTAADAGTFVALLKLFAANNLTALVPAGVTINRTTSATKATVGLLLIYCDGVEYWA